MHSREEKPSTGTHSEKFIPAILAGTLELATLTQESMEEDDFFHLWVHTCVDAFNEGDLNDYFETLVLGRIAQRLQEKNSLAVLMNTTTLPVLFTELLLLARNTSKHPALENLSAETIEIKIQTALCEYPQTIREYFDEQVHQWYRRFSLKWVKEKIEQSNSNPMEVIWQAYNLGIITDSYCEDAFYKSFLRAGESKSDTIKMIQDNDSVLLHALSAYLTDNKLPTCLPENNNSFSMILGSTRTDINAHAKTNQLFYKALWDFLLDKELENKPGTYHKSAPLLHQKHLYLTVNQNNPLDAENKEGILKLIELNKFETLIINHGELTQFYYNYDQGIVINDKFMSNEQVEHITKIATLIKEEEKQNISLAKSSFGFYYLAPIETRLEQLAHANKNSEDKAESFGVNTI